MRTQRRLPAPSPKAGNHPTSHCLAQTLFLLGLSVLIPSIAVLTGIAGAITALNGLRGYPMMPYLGLGIAGLSLVAALCVTFAFTLLRLTWHLTLVIGGVILALARLDLLMFVAFGLLVFSVGRAVFRRLPRPRHRRLPPGDRQRPPIQLMGQG